MSKADNKYIVAIGASAGGLEAIHQFFDHMPESPSFSFILIQHLSSDYKSLLVELVSKHTHMKVFEAAHDMTIQQGCVYVIPNNKLMTVSNGRLKLADKSLIKAPNTAIDTFLHTLASDKKDKAIAIILSGTGTDGTKGIQSIKKYGGLVIVQEPASSKFDGMPNSAISTGDVDFVLPPQKIFEELFNYINEEPVKVLQDGKIDENLLEDIFKMVLEQNGNDFNLYKTPTIIRRIGRRMNEHHFKTLDGYVNFLRTDEAEVKILGQDFLIGVTKFFRDKQAFELLEKNILPDMINRKVGRDPLKIWICACSTGQEAYSIAITINEYLEKVNRQLEIKIFATDIDGKSIEIAAKNKYPLNIKKEVPTQILKKYFTKEGDFYSVKPEIRKQIVFAKHDVTKSPPFIKNDLVSCRNMLIYMNSILQGKILSAFHFSLVKNGYLMLGSSESANILKDGLTEISGKWKIYQKTGSINYSSFNTYHSNGKLLVNKEKSSYTDPSLSQSEKRFTKFMTTDLEMVGVFIDKSYIIQEAIGNYRQFLSLPDLKIELNILKMVPKELSIVLNNALRNAWKDNEKVHLNRIRVQRNGEEVYLNISVQPPNEEFSYTMIVFGQSGIEVIPDKEVLDLSALTGEQHTEYIFELEAELNETRNNLQLAVEEMETTNEELQSTNEEMLSANEELQSSNEELQSLNEELHTLNTEHQLKIKELIELNDDLDNYFRSTDIGQVYLDSSLTIRKFNQSAISMVNLIPADIGRSIEHISNNIKAENLNEDIRSVLLSGNVLEKNVSLKNETSGLMRIMPYIRKDKKKDGVVINFIDISHITELNNMINGVFNASLSGIIAFNSLRNHDHLIIDFKCLSFNNTALKFLHKSEKDLTNAMLVKQIPELISGNLFQKYINVVEKGIVLETEICSSDERWYHLVAVKMVDGFVATLTDITDKKAAEIKFKRNYSELIGVRESLKKLNTDLELMVKERTKELSESEERFNQVSMATNDTIWDWNFVNNKMWRSDNFTAMFGYSNDDQSNTIGFWFNHIHPEDKKRVQDSVYDAINSHKKQWSAEYRIKKNDGDYAIVLDRGTIIHDDFETPYRMVGSMVDITRQIEAETKLSESENKFRKIFESNVIGMLFSNLHTGVIHDANEAFLNMIGYKKEDLLNDLLKWEQITPTEHQPISRQGINHLIKDGMCPPFEKQYFHKDGSKISVMVGSALLDENNPHEVVTYIINISAQKKIEKRQNELQNLIKKQQDEFYSIFKNAPALITIRRGSELVYEFVNNAFIEFNGVQNYIGKPSAQIQSKLANSKIYEVEQLVIKTGETQVAKSLLINRINPVTKENLSYWFDLILTPVFDAEGEIDGITLFGFEVTDLIRAQESTKELMQKKDEFMSIASHELKTPITSIQGFLQLAQRFAEKNKSEKILLNFIGKANRQLGNLTSLVNDLLDVTKIQAGKMQFNYSKFNFRDMMYECVEDFQGIEGHEVIIEYAEDVTGTADKHRIEQVINNFLSNAIKYSPNARKVIIYARTIDNYWMLTVKDFGMGIPPEKSHQVFDRFFRIDNNTNMISGLGLGLYISAEIIKRHEGEIGVDSGENGGSEFWFKIPLEVSFKRD